MHLLSAEKRGHACFMWVAVCDCQKCICVFTRIQITLQKVDSH